MGGRFGRPLGPRSFPTPSLLAEPRFAGRCRRTGELALGKQRPSRLGRFLNWRMDRRLHTPVSRQRFPLCEAGPAG